MTCTWCGEPVAAGEGFRAFEPAGARRAVFCRLEHVVPWAIRGATWEPATGAPPAEASALEACAWCGADLAEATRVLVVRARGEQRVADGFCTVEHLLAWAKAGGRYATG
jgi:uncharacterized protein involved in copper resistance